MEPAVTALLAEYERRAAEEWRLMEALPVEQIGARIDELLLFVGPDTGRLLHMLATSSQAKAIVEIGASYGYSTIWLADAAKKTGGKVHSFELSPNKVAYARDKLRSVGLEPHVEVPRRQRARHAARARGAGGSGADRPVEAALQTLLRARLSQALGGCARRRRQHALPKETRAEARAYEQFVRAPGDLDSVLLPIGSGIEISRKRS